MKAVLLIQYGGVDQLYYKDVEKPQPGAGEVLVRVISTSVNPVDYKIRRGDLKGVMKMKLPAILGRDVAGEVAGLGEGVTSFQPGDRVMGLVNRSYAEFLIAKAAELTKIPDGLDTENAGVLPLVTLTGAQLAEEGIAPKAGETVLVTGALGGVGRTAIFVCKQAGAKVIAGVRASQRSQAQLLGADSVIALDSDSDIAGLPELDAIADTVGGETIAKLIPHMKKAGRLASVVGKSADADTAGITFKAIGAHPDPVRLHKLAQDYRDGHLKIPIARRMRLSEIREAHSAGEKGVDGKIELQP